MSSKRTNYFRRLIDEKDPASSKRFLGLAMSGFLIVASFFLLLVRVPNANTQLLDRCLLYAMIIVAMSLFGLAVDKVAEILLSVSKTQAAAQILSPTKEGEKPAPTSTTSSTTIGVEKLNQEINRISKFSDEEDDN